MVDFEYCTLNIYPIGTSIETMVQGLDCTKATLQVATWQDAHDYQLPPVDEEGKEQNQIVLVYPAARKATGGIFSPMLRSHRPGAWVKETAWAGRLAHRRFSAGGIAWTTHIGFTSTEDS
ncbi:hypothetical protein CSOJ01_15416 [Colletotrichum sojae]|uniref:Uncharacterized protein n=1 Tax=Colletotrichum sojae TaxID=2175907 RepID=A0A8H6MIN1_9PEZI|nr:hypothetical protein CSOJ01_15416 [Colletotrichum sojae]